MSYGHDDRPPSVLVARRGAGKTYQTIEWLTQGQKRDDWPQWSRVLVVMNRNWAVALVREYSNTTVGGIFYENAGYNLSKVILTLEEFRNLRGVPLGSLEIAVDDADSIIEDALRARPSWLTLSGDLAAPTSVTRAG